MTRPLLLLLVQILLKFLVASKKIGIRVLFLRKNFRTVLLYTDLEEASHVSVKDPSILFCQNRIPGKLGIDTAMTGRRRLSFVWLSVQYMLYYCCPSNLKIY